MPRSPCSAQASSASLGDIHPSQPSQPQQKLKTPAAKTAAGSPTPMKLRDSCNSCAASKLKCSKEKLGCARCAKRNIECTYMTTKRRGRRSASYNATQSLQSLPGSEMTPVYMPSSNNFLLACPDNNNNNNNNNNTAHNAADDGSLSRRPSSSNITSPSSISSGSLFVVPFSELMNEGAGSVIDDAEQGHRQPQLCTAFVPTPSGAYSGPGGDSANDCDDGTIGVNSFANLELQSLSPSMGDGQSQRTASATFRDSLFTFDDILKEATSFPVDFENMVVDEPRLHHSNGPDACSMRVCALMREISTSSSPACEREGGADLHLDPLSLSQDLRSVKQKVLQMTREILDCSCSQDGGILVMLVLLLLKLLECYAAVARQPCLWQNGHSSRGLKGRRESGSNSSTSTSSGSIAMNLPSITDNFKANFGATLDTISLGQDQNETVTLHHSASFLISDADEVDAGYTAAQSVLSELHGVQRLVNQLSVSLQEHGSKGGTSHGLGHLATQNSHDRSISWTEGRVSSFPLSPALCKQLDTDLRNSLQSLAQDVVQILRRDR